MWVNFKFLKFIIDRILYFLLRLTKLQHYLSNRKALKLVFSAKICFKVVVGLKIEAAIVFLVDPYY